jgi:hypothetical protein
MKLWMIVALEILLPGGSLLALALFLYRHRKTIARYLTVGRDAASSGVSRLRSDLYNPQVGARLFVRKLKASNAVPWFQEDT